MWVPEGRTVEGIVESYVVVLVLIKLPCFCLTPFGQGFKESSNSPGNAPSCPKAQLTPEGEANANHSAAPSSSASIFTSCQHQ